MLAIFRRSPDSPSDDYTESHQGRGLDYDSRFDTLPMRTLMWELEQQLVDDLLTLTEGVDTVVDLACGTGRLTGALARNLPGAEITGVDVADSMLSVARDNVPGANFIAQDVRELDQSFPASSVDLLSAFRFFPNADQDLRDAAVAAIGAAVRPDGYVLINNHRNFWSTSYTARRVRSASAPGALNRDVVGPLLSSGFTITARQSLGVVPQTEAKPYVVSRGVASRMERRNAGTLGRRHTLGTNTIWLLRKTA